MPGTMTAGGKTLPSIQATFDDALAKLPDGYVRRSRIATVVFVLV
jgi:hypothetical protein